MLNVFIVIAGLPVLAFFGWFFLAICRDGHHAKTCHVVEVVLSPKTGEDGEPKLRTRKSA